MKSQRNGFAQPHFSSRSISFYKCVDFFRIKKWKKSGAGFTLIELMLVLFFTGILITVVFSLYDWHNKIYYYQQGLVQTSASSRTAVTTMQTYVAQANQVLASASVSGTTYTTSANTLVLQLPAIDSSNNIVSGKWDEAAFYPSGSNFYFRLEPDAASSRRQTYKLLSDSLSSISLTYDNATMSMVKEVTVNFKNQLQVKNQTVTSNLQQNMYLANY